MDLQNLENDRFLRKDPNQSDKTKDAAYSALNPAPKRGDDQYRKIGRPKGSEEDDGAPNILTGTVIVSCFIQTSALPSRIELQGNDLTFFDDTIEQNHKVIGDTSRLIFTHASGKVGGIVSEGFIIEKRASSFSTYDNVLALYALPPRNSSQNVFYIGRNGTANAVQISYIEITINHDTNRENSEGFPNGEFAIGGVTNGGAISRNPNFAVVHNSILGILTDGYSLRLRGSGGGLIGIESVVIPNPDASFDLGSASHRFRNIYLSGGIGISGGVTWTSGSGSPEAAVAAPVGSLYSNTAGGASTTLYVKTGGGTGNTGWTAK